MNPDAPFGYMSYNPHTESGPNIDYNMAHIPYPINPLDIQIFYKKLFDIFCGSFPDKTGEFIGMLRLYNGDYRRSVINIEHTLVNKETEYMKEMFGARLET